MKKIATLFAALLFFGLINLYAQPADPDDPGSGDPPVGGDTPVGVPIDGGAVALLIAGTAYGVKKLHKKNQNKTEDIQ